MRKTWWRSAGGDDFEGALLRNRPEPREELLQALEARAEQHGRRARGRSARLAFAGAFVAVALGALASVGGLSYAATVTQGAVIAVKKVVAPKAVKAPKTKRATAALVKQNAGGDQYRPGFGFGDPNHNHTGPPGLQRRGPGGRAGAALPPLRAVGTDNGLAYLVSTQLNLDEQSHLYIGVRDPQGNFLLLTQRSQRGGSTVGGGLTGPCCTKFIQYAVLVPRTFPLSLRIPGNLVKPGVQYQIRIVAFDPQGNRSEILIPFTPSPAA